MMFLISITVCYLALTNGQIQPQYNIDPIQTERVYYDNRAGDQKISPEFSQRVFPDAILGNVRNNQPSLELLPPYKTEEDAPPNIVSRIQESVDIDDDTPNPIISKFDNVSLGVTNFAVNLMKNINELQRGNTVVSPYSIVTLLGILQQGSFGVTLEQISQALQMSPEISAAAYKKLTDNLDKRSSRNLLKIANNVFVAEGFAINPQFKKIAQSGFGSEVTPTNFGNSLLASQKINNWVATKTNNKIEKLVSPDSLDINSQLVLVNTMYFKGLWQIIFRTESTKPQEFQLSNGGVKTTPFMRMRHNFRTGVDKTNGAQVISLPFENEEYSLMIVLPPKSSNVSTLIASLTYNQLTSYHSFSSKEVMLVLPKFTIRADTDLTLVCQKMGIVNIFSQYAELHALGTYRTISPQVSSAIHSAMLSIDEEGGAAAAATAFAVVALSYEDPPIVFEANRPFLAVLWDNQAALPLFMAKVEDPSI